MRRRALQRPLLTLLHHNLLSHTRTRPAFTPRMLPMTSLSRTSAPASSSARNQLTASQIECMSHKPLVSLPSASFTSNNNNNNSSKQHTRTSTPTHATVILRDATAADFDDITRIYGYYVREASMSFELVAPPKEEMISRWNTVCVFT